jgi:hypothetical protein
MRAGTKGKEIKAVRSLAVGRGEWYIHRRCGFCLSFHSRTDPFAEWFYYTCVHFCRTFHFEKPYGPNKQDCRSSKPHRKKGSYYLIIAEKIKARRDRKYDGKLQKYDWGLRELVKTIHSSSSGVGEVIEKGRREGQKRRGEGKSFYRKDGKHRGRPKK